MTVIGVINERTRLQEFVREITIFLHLIREAEGKRLFTKYEL